MSLNLKENLENKILLSLIDKFVFFLKAIVSIIGAAVWAFAIWDGDE